jgi:hypothetical protein
LDNKILKRWASLSLGNLPIRESIFVLTGFDTVLASNQNGALEVRKSMSD